MSVEVIRATSEQGLLTKTVTISSADVLQLNTSPVSLVDAPGAGKAVMIVDAIASIDFNTAPYDTSGNLRIEGGDEYQIRWVAAGFLFATKTRHVRGFFNSLGGVTAGETQIVENKEIFVKCESADPQNGDSDISIKVYYRIIDV